MKKPSFTATYEMQPIQEILKKRGLGRNGAVQMQLTRIVNNRITAYMPYRTGVLATKLKRVVSPQSILIEGPYARYQYYGEIMVDPVTGAAGFQLKDGTWRSRKNVPKVRSGRDIHYDKTKNPQAGPYWDRRLVAAERDVIVEELQDYVNSRGGGAK